MMETNMIMNIKIILAFDGTNYHGWQEQENASTIQGELLQAIKSVMGDVQGVTGVSRTDSGVHAHYFVANFRTQKDIPLSNIKKAINSHLPHDIRVLDAQRADDDFNARFDCKNKTYIYRICNSEVQSPFERLYSWHFPHKLDISKMQEAAGYFVGEKDFSAFCASGEQREGKVRTINSLTISKESDIVTIEVNADGFLYNMVRIIAGTLIEIGIGRYEPRDVKAIIEACDRTKSGQTAPSCGLFLKKAYY